MTVETDIDDLAARVNIRKDKAVRVKGDLDALVTEGTSVAALTTTATASALVVRTEATSMSTAATALATSAVGASSFADLSALAASKTDVATDVFIYDTSLDSDGGAWRFRTQGTSWYQETLNTATRGSRREFPAVAVIVTTSSTVTIYDGDTVGLPMWMVFNADFSYASRLSLGAGGSFSSIAALNGAICLGSKNGPSNSGVNALFVLDFAAGRATKRANTGFLVWSGGLSGTNSDGSYVKIGGDAVIIVNDVAMTVLPNAPIDSTTGLPVPTIAVATASGVSVIKNDGTVVNINQTNQGVGAFAVEFEGDSVSFSTNNDIGAMYWRWTEKIPSSNNILSSLWYDQGTADEGYNTFPNFGFEVNTLKLGNAWDMKHVANNHLAGFRGLIQLKKDNSNYRKSLFANVTASYNTGWMNHNTKIACLCDTSDADLLGGDLVKNGSFDVDLSNWTILPNKAGDITWSAGRAKFLSDSIADSGGHNAIEQTLSLVVGQAYKISLTVDAPVSGPFNTRVIVHNAEVLAWSDLASGTRSSTFIATSATSKLTIIGAAFNTTSEVYIDSISVRVADADRSANGIGLNIVGRIQRTPVADNADLVAYTGFSATNYLEQPYNAGLDFGTGDFSIIGWGRTMYNGTFLSRGDGVSAGSWYWYHMGGSSSPLYIHDGTTFRLALNLSLPQAEMLNFALVRRSGTLSLYGNGQLIGSSSGAYPALTMTNTTAKLRIGEQQHISYVSPASRLALLRVSTTAPSADQIAKIYKDERKMFEPGARCTLYGASDAVTGLAYDKVTNLLHVGTSAGRSVFDGLVRVSNTTTPVRAVIAAHGGLVIED